MERLRQDLVMNYKPNFWILKVQCFTNPTLHSPYRPNNYIHTELRKSDVVK